MPNSEDRVHGHRTFQHTKRMVYSEDDSSVLFSLNTHSRAEQSTRDISIILLRFPIEQLDSACVVEQIQILFVQPHIGDANVVREHIRTVYLIRKLGPECMSNKRVLRDDNSPSAQPRSTIESACTPYRSEISTFSPPHVFN